MPASTSELSSSSTAIAECMHVVLLGIEAHLLVCVHTRYNLVDINMFDLLLGAPYDTTLRHCDRWDLIAVDAFIMIVWNYALQ